MYVIIYIRLFSIIICNLLIDFPRMLSWDRDFVPIVNNFVSFENRVLYEIMWKNTVQPDRAHMAI